VAWDSGKLKRLGRVDMRRPLLEAFAKKLSKDDGVVVEATGNAASVAAVIAPHVKKVVGSGEIISIHRELCRGDNRRS
jgi:transposase